MMKSLPLLLCACLALAACDATNGVWWGMQDTLARVFRSPDVNLKEKSAAAADYIAPQIKTYIHRETQTVSTQPLGLVKETAVTSEFGRVVPVQIAERLRQLGYDVILPDENGASRTGDFVIGGTYDRDGRDTFVNLRVTETASGKVIGAFDYNMPTTDEIKKLAAPEARIYRIQQ